MTKMDPYTLEIIEYSMDERGPDMGPTTDARAGKFAVDELPDDDCEPTASQLYITNDPRLYAPIQASEVPVVKADSKDFLKTKHGLSDKVATYLSEYFGLLKEQQVLLGEDAYYRTRLEAIKEAKNMCENPDVWNHIPLTREEKRARLVVDTLGLNNKENPMADVFRASKSTVNNTDEQIATAIGKAIRHAERIAKRDHIKADRVERVNLYLTSLRRELGYLADTNGVDLVNSLCRKEVWYDAGILSINLCGVYGLRYSKDNIQKWLDIAKRQRGTIESARFQIEGDLEELERGLAGALIACEDAQRINQEGDVVLSELNQIFNPVTV